MRFPYQIHNLCLLVLSPVIVFVVIIRYLTGKSKEGWRERWGVYPDHFLSKIGNSPIWVHAVSAGEVVAAVPILRELRKLLPDQTIILSVITPAGHEIGLQQAKPYIDGLFYAPVDLPWVTKRVVRKINPCCYISLESELWPNVLHDLKQHRTVTAMVNARLSERSFQRASGYAPWLYRWMLDNMDLLLVQSEADKMRFMKLGKISEPQKVMVLGNSKFDQEISELTPDDILTLRKSLRMPENAPIFVAGSSRSSEEENEIIYAYTELLKRFPDLCLIIAPRDIKRADELRSSMQAAGFLPALRTEPNISTPGSRQLILNTIGELANVYAVAAITFVGNSIPPVVKGGGQNILQPLAHGKPVFVGPQIATIRSEFALASQAGIAFQIQNGSDLEIKTEELLSDSARLSSISETAISLIKSNRGIAMRYASEIVNLLYQDTTSAANFLDNARVL